MTAKLRQLVLVTWLDAGSGDTAEEAAGHLRESVGFFLKRNKLGVWLSMESDAGSGIHFIPRGMIRDLSEIEWEG